MAQTSTEKIGVKDAVRIARDYVKAVYEDEPISNLLLEEVQLSEDERFWEITYGFDTEREYMATDFIDPLQKRLHDLAGRPPKYLRAYKLIRVNILTGNVEGMQIRKI